MLRHGIISIRCNYRNVSHDFAEQYNEVVSITSGIGGTSRISSCVSSITSISCMSVVAFFLCGGLRRTSDRPGGWCAFWTFPAIPPSIANCSLDALTQSSNFSIQDLHHLLFLCRIREYHHKGALLRNTVTPPDFFPGAFTARTSTHPEQDGVNIRSCTTSPNFRHTTHP